MGHYQSWWKARIDTFDRILVPDFFRQKRVLDMGAGFGTFSKFLQERGAVVTASDGRSEYVDVIKSRFGDGIATVIEDYDSHEFAVGVEELDIICHFGVMQHLVNIERHLDKLVGKSKYLFIECDVIDSNDPALFNTVAQNGYDQALNGTGCQFSPAYIERLLAERGLAFIAIAEPSLDTMVHKYSWPIKNTNKLAPGQARLWVCAQAGYRLDDIFSKLYNTDIRPVFDSIVPEVKEVIYDSIVNYQYLGMAIAQKQPRINAYVSAALVEDVIDKLKLSNYVIVDRPYKSLAKPGMVSILAVAVADSQSAQQDSDVTFVIQGMDAGLKTETVRNICFTYGRVLNATWTEESLAEAKRAVIANGYMNKQNVYFQIAGTLEGLKQVTTRFTVKIRADEYYCNIRPILERLRAYPDSVISNNIFARATQSFPFHISDHLIAGSRENMLKMFEEAYKSIVEKWEAPKVKFYVAEQRLTMCYVAARQGCAVTELPVKDHAAIRGLMMKYFWIISVKQLGGFYASANSMQQKCLTHASSPRDYRAFVDIESIEAV